MAATIEYISKQIDAGTEMGKIKVTIPRADVLTIFDTSVVITPNVSSGKILVMDRPIGRLQFNGTPTAYTMQDDLVIRVTDGDGTSIYQGLADMMGDVGINYIVPMEPLTNGAGTYYKSGKTYFIQGLSGNPTAGNNCDLVIYYSYSILTL